MEAKIAEVTGDKTIPQRLDGSSNLLEDLGLDSLQMINLILLVESEFSVEVDFDSFDMHHLSSMDRFTDYIKGLQPR